MTDQVREIRGLLREAIECLEEGVPQMAAWRVADAGGLLRAVLEARGRPNISGCHEITGRGCMLPQLAETEEPR